MTEKTLVIDTEAFLKSDVIKVMAEKLGAHVVDIKLSPFDPSDVTWLTNTSEENSARIDKINEATNMVFDQMINEKLINLPGGHAGYTGWSRESLAREMQEELRPTPDTSNWSICEDPYRAGLDNAARALIWYPSADRKDQDYQISICASGNGEEGDLDLNLWINGANTPAAVRWCELFGGNPEEDVDECATLNGYDPEWMVKMRGSWSLLMNKLNAAFGTQPPTLVDLGYLLTGHVPQRKLPSES